MTEELKRLYLDANVNIQLVRTIELQHPSFSKTWYLVQSNKKFTAFLEDETTEVTYIPWGFDVQLPRQSSKGQDNAQFVIDVTDSEVLNELFAYKNDPRTPIILKWREYISTSKYVQAGPVEVKLMDIQFDYNSISGAGSKPDIVNRGFPYARYDGQIYKGLLYV